MRRNRLRKGLLSIVLTIAMVLGMTPLPLFTMEVQAVTETRTVTFYMDGGASGNTSMQDDWTLVSSGKTLHWSNDDPENNKISWRSNKKIADFRSNVIECNGVIEFPNLEGNVKSVALTNFQFTKSGMQMYVGLVIFVALWRIFFSPELISLLRLSMLRQRIRGANATSLTAASVGGISLTLQRDALNSHRCQYSKLVRRSFSAMRAAIW